MTNLYLTLTLLLSLLCGGFWNSIKGQCDHPDLDALVALYNSTEGNIWDTGNGWAAGAAGTDCDPCRWYGVTCDETNRVKSISLSACQLSGSIPAELGNLSNLTYLVLTGNQLSGSIPAELGNLTNLKTLSLGGNQLSGGIPVEFGNLTNLTSLTLSYNQLSGSIPAELENLVNLKGLILSGNQLSGSIPAVLENLMNLEGLLLSGNQLSGSIPAELGNLTNLIALDLGTNELSGSIPVALGNLSNLSVLRLYDNQLSGEIPASLSNLTTLNQLYLQKNQLIGCFPAALQTHCSLGFSTDIHQSGYNLTGNLELPWGGDFTRFCDGEDSCGTTQTTSPDGSFPNILLFPNPTTDFIQISETEDIVAISLLTPQGLLVNTFSTSFERIDVSHLNSGLYLLQIKTRNGAAFTYRFVKI